MSARITIHQGKIDGIKLIWNRKTLDIDAIESYEDHLIFVVNQAPVPVKETFNELTVLIRESEQNRAITGGD